MKAAFFFVFCAATFAYAAEKRPAIHFRQGGRGVSRPRADC